MAIRQAWAVSLASAGRTTHNPGMARNEAIFEAGRLRFRPILMTALTVGLALLPFLLFGNIPGHEVVRPVAIAILGGLFTSTFYTLFIVPALYLRFGASREADLGIVPVPASTEA